MQRAPLSIQNDAKQCWTAVEVCQDFAVCFSFSTCCLLNGQDALLAMVVDEQV